MTFFYLGALLFAVTGMLVLDWHFTLAFWRDARRTTATLGAAMAFFILWDMMGIFLGVFKHGSSPYMLPFTIFPEFPLEEVVFLFLLTYSALVIYNGVALWHSRTSR